MMDGKIKGRGALSNREGRFARYEREVDLDALAQRPPVQTTRAEMPAVEQGREPLPSPNR